jgi:AraC family transcriptional regulator
MNTTLATRLRCVVPLFDRHASRRIVPVHDARSVATAQALDWPGVLLEAGRNDVVEVDDLTLAHHYFGINTDRRPVTMEVKDQHGWRAVRLDPWTGWFSPAGHGFSLRVKAAGPHSYARISFDPIRFDRLLRSSDDTATPIVLKRSYDIGGPQVRHLVSALTEEARAGTPSGLAFVETLTAALALQLVKQAGTAPPRRERIRGGLAPAVRRRVLDLMEARASGRLSLDELAGEAGLSPAHFARAFKESVGRAPHQHLLSLRLDRARRLLDAPDAGLSDIALRTGFADQAHFTRFFKRRFGVTPGALLRGRR